MEVITSNIIQRVYAISLDQKSMGSCFAYPIKDIYVYITAAHVLSGLEHAQKSRVTVYKDERWIEIEVTPYFYRERSYVGGDVDLAILVTTMPSKGDSVPPLALGSSGLILGQDTYFLGFPYFGNIDHRPEKINGGFPIPFVKKGTACGFHFADGMLFIDGHNNPGFSGGPLVFWDYKERKHKIAGVISAYLTHTGEVKEFSASSKQYYQENSGIGIAYRAELIREMASKIFGAYSL